MNEYAVLSPSGEVVSIVMVNMPIAHVQAMYQDGYVVKPLDEVPEETLKRYEFWEQRP